MNKKGRWYITAKNALLKNIRLFAFISLFTQVIALLIIFSVSLFNFQGSPDIFRNDTDFIVMLFLGLVIGYSLTVTIASYFIGNETAAPEDNRDDTMRALDIESAPWFNNLERPIVFENGLRKIDDREFSKQILKLFRSAERLDNAEKDLIRRLMENQLVDRSAQKLLSEVQICTCRMIKQLTEFQQNNPISNTESSKENIPL